MVNFEILSSKASKGPILLTGHTGFKGTWMTLLLEGLGLEVAGLSLPPTDESMYSLLGRDSKINEHFGDIRSTEFTKSVFKEVKPCAVIHMAAQPLVIESYAHPEKTFETNIMGTVNVLSAAREYEVEIVQVITTDKVYKNLNIGKKFTEEDSLSGNDPYSASKVGTEAVVAAWKQIYQVTGGTLVHSVRAGNVIGGGDLAKNRLLPDIIRNIKEKKAVEIRSLESTRPWQHVLDPLSGYLSALNLNWQNGTQENFNFGPTERSLSVREVLEIIEEATPEFNWFEKKAEKKGMESERLDLDSSKARDMLGWSPQLTQRDAILRTLAWWNHEGPTKHSWIDACEEDIREVLFK